MLLLKVKELYQAHGSEETGALLMTLKTIQSLQAEVLEGLAERAIFRLRAVGTQNCSPP